MTASCATVWLLCCELHGVVEARDGFLRQDVAASTATIVAQNQTVHSYRP